LSKSWISDRLKESIKHEYDIKLENHKMQLKSENEKELERIKIELSKTAEKEQYQFELVYKRRIEIIDNIQLLIRKLHMLVREYITIGKDNVEKGRELQLNSVGLLNELRDFYVVNSLYLPKEIGDLVSSINENMNMIIAQFDAYIIKNNPYDHSTNMFKKWAELFTLLETKLPGVYQALREAFRDLVGTQ
jgi:hypothetical protein